MTRIYERNVIMMVSQQPFTHGVNRFCNLTPIIYDDGEEASEYDFPNDGQVWWMLLATNAYLAKPGQLLVGRIEDSSNYGSEDPEKSYYQVERQSVKELSASVGLGIVDIPSDSIENIRDLVDGDTRVQIEFPLTRRVAIRWRNQIYAPFRAELDQDADRDDNDAYTYSFHPDSHESKVHCFDNDAFMSAVGNYYHEIRRTVSLVKQRVIVSSVTSVACHELILAPGWDEALKLDSLTVDLEPLEKRLLRYAKAITTRKEYRELRDTLHRLQIGGRDHEDNEDLARTIPRMIERIQRYDDSLDRVADALLKSGRLGEDRLKEAEERHADNYIRSQVARLQAQISAEVKSHSEVLSKLKSEIAELRGRIEREEAFRRHEFEEELEEERATMLQEVESAQQRVEEQKGELDNQRAILQESLERVTAELRDAGQDVVNKYLAIKPLLEAGLPMAADRRTAEITTSNVGTGEQSLSKEYEFPDYAERTRETNSPLISEEEFFERFVKTVEDSGYAYRRLDLKRFHLSVKLGEMTVLGGPSGTGKSSLPFLYGRALAGAERDRPACLMVNVNPSWMDPRDLLGHLNSIDRRFYPSETGLFRHLVNADHERKRWHDRAGVSLVCLDEMNLSQVEHYFSDFMMILERSQDARILHCFDEHAVGSHCPYRKFSRVNVSPAINFIGTVNFDESTRLLSDRLLDRVNLIKLISDGLAVTDTTMDNICISGRAIQLVDIASWRKDSTFPPALAAMIDEMRPLLVRLGAPLSPRVYGAIVRYVIAAEGILDPSEAFDVQLAQRVLPKIRGVMTADRRAALDDFDALLDRPSLGGFDEARFMVEIIKKDAGPDAWLGEG